MRKTKPAKYRPVTKRASARKTVARKRSSQRASANLTSKPTSAKRPSAATVEQYIAAANAAARPALKQIRAAILSVVPAESVEIISYQIPAFKHKKVLVWYAAFNEHCSLFPTAAVVGQFKDELRGYSTSKGT